MITIKRDLNTVVAEFKPLTSSTLVKEVMGDEQITLAWEQAQYVELQIGDYIEYEGARWTLNSLPTVKKNSSRSFRYDAIFQSTKYDLAKVMYLLFDNTTTSPPGEVGESMAIPPRGEFSLTGNSHMFMELLVANLNRVAGSSLWSLGQVVEDTKYITLTFSNEDCLTVLGRLADEFGREYHINNRLIHLRRISTNREIALEYGSTLYDIERVSMDESSLVTRLYPYGSTRNLPGDYRGGNMPLCIPDTMGEYIESDKVLLYGIAEKSISFNEIYPRLSSGGAGIVTSVDDMLTFTDSALDFDVNDCLLDGAKAKVHFNTGQCAGYSFEIQRYSHSTKTFTLISNNQENDFELPTESIRPAAGDRYVLLDIVMPESYRINAEQELADKATEWLEQNDTPKVTYKATFSAIYARQNLQNIECGDTVQIVDSDLGIDEEIRIVKLTKGIADYWTVQFDLSDTVTKTTLQHITDGISTVQNEIVTSNIRINENTRRSYLNTKELRDMVFDGEGYFDPENIKPLSIETSMLTVGARPQSFQLSMLLQPNYAGNAQVLQWGAGVLAHFTIDDDEVVEWVIPQGSITISGSNQTKGLYIYARCSRTTSSGTLYLDSAQYAFDHDPNYWYFLVGVLHSPVDGVRGISLTYGQTTINGRFLNTGRVQSANGETFFDLDTGVIQGNIRFKSGQSAEDYIDGEIGNIDVGGENLLTHNPDNWELGTFNSTTGNPTNSSVNIRTKNMVTFSANKDHIINRFGSGTLYAYEYTGSGGTGFVKMTTITSFPHLIPKLTSARYYKFRITTSNLNLLGSTYRFKVEQGNIPTDWSIPAVDIEDKVNEAITTAGDAHAQAQLLAYLQEAFENDTTIQGGVVSTSLIRLGVETEKAVWVENAGIFGGGTTQGGLGSSNVPRIYAGGTLEDAIARVQQNDWENGAKCVITHAGKLYAIDVELIGSLSTKPEGARILLDGVNNVISIYGDNSDTPKAQITPEAIPTLSSLLSGILMTMAVPLSLSVSAQGGNSDTETKYSATLSLPTTGASYKVTTPPINLYYRVHNGASTDGDGGIGQPASVNITAKLVRTTTPPLEYIIYNETFSPPQGVSLIQDTFTVPQKVFNNIAPGSYRIEASLTARSRLVPNPITPSSAQATLTIASPQNILQGVSPVDVSRVYSNGIYLVKDGNNYIYMNPSGIEEKTQTAPNRPGVLLAGTVNGGGGFANVWGPKQHSSGAVWNSAGRYTVYHSIGHQNYSVVASPRESNRSHYIVSKGSTNFVILWSTIGGLSSPKDTLFDFTISGNN